MIEGFSKAGAAITAEESRLEKIVLRWDYFPIYTNPRGVRSHFWICTWVQLVSNYLKRKWAGMTRVTHQIYPSNALCSIICNRIEDIFRLKQHLRDKETK